MAIREVRIMGDDILEKQCKPVTKMTMRTKILIEDMLDTMYEKYGVGLAAPQVGVLKQIVVIDVGEGPIVLINPEIIETSGEQTGEEGCLSLPGKSGIVTRPNYVKANPASRYAEQADHPFNNANNWKQLNYTADSEIIAGKMIHFNFDPVKTKAIRARMTRKDTTNGVALVEFTAVTPTETLQSTTVTNITVNWSSLG